MNNPLGYPDPVWTLFRDPPRAGHLDDTDADVAAALASSPAQGTRLRVQVRRDADGGIREARFQALGCPYTIACGAWMAQWLEGRAPAGFAGDPTPELRAALEIPEDRAHCWIMAQDIWRALKPDTTQ